MLTRLFAAVDRLSFACTAVAMALLVGLVGATTYEVVARYAFNAPTVWAYDVAYMLNGGLFLLAAAFTLAKNNHVRIDFLSVRLSIRSQHAINAAFYLVLLLPALALIARSSALSAWEAFATGKVEAVSPWQPRIWPFYTAIAAGLAMLWLQALIEALRHLRGCIDPSAVAAPGVNRPH